MLSFIPQYSVFYSSDHRIEFLVENFLHFLWISCSSGNLQGINVFPLFKAGWSSKQGDVHDVIFKQRPFHCLSIPPLNFSPDTWNSSTFVLYYSSHRPDYNPQSRNFSSFFLCLQSDRTRTVEQGEAQSRVLKGVERSAYTLQKQRKPQIMGTHAHWTKRTEILATPTKPSRTKNFFMMKKCSNVDNKA